MVYDCGYLSLSIKPWRQLPALIMCSLDCGISALKEITEEESNVNVVIKYLKGQCHKMQISSRVLEKFETAHMQGIIRGHAGKDNW
jgi:hypothetical protein